MIKEDVFEIIRTAEDNFLHGTTKTGEYVDFQMHDVIEKITAYINSKHTTGDTDSLGREKPFFNICTAAINIWYRATDIDRKDITVSPDGSSTVVASFLATVLLQNWMREQRFGVFLNQWGRTLSQFGSAVVKFVEKDGKLIPTVIPWNRLVVDTMDFTALPVIEKLNKTPAQLRKEKNYDQDVVENLLNSRNVRKNLRGEQKDSKNNFIEIYEVHGELPLALLKKKPSDKDWETYVQQVHVISYMANRDGKNDDYCLYKGKEKNNPYMLTHLIEEEGRTLSIGAVETLFDAQWMQNHTIKNMKDTLDLSSKLIFQTADTHYIGRNVLSAIETGDILIHAPDKPLTQINNAKQDVVALQNFAGMWKQLEQELTSTTDAMRGVNPPSGTPYSTTAALLNQASSLFEIMVENKGHHIEDMLRTYIIPHLKTKMNHKKEIMGILEDRDIKKIDAMYIPKAAIALHEERNLEKVLNGEMPDEFNQQGAEQAMQQQMSQQGNQRFFDPEDITWKEVTKDLEWKLNVGVTNEPMDKQAMLTTLSTLLQSIAGNPMVLQDPNMKLIFSKIMNLTGAASPLELSMSTSAPPVPTEMPQPGRAPAPLSA